VSARMLYKLATFRTQLLLGVQTHIVHVGEAVSQHSARRLLLIHPKNAKCNIILNKIKHSRRCQTNAGAGRVARPSRSWIMCKIASNQGLKHLTEG